MDSTREFIPSRVSSQRTAKPYHMPSDPHPPDKSRTVGVMVLLLLGTLVLLDLSRSKQVFTWRVEWATKVKKTG